MSEEECLWCHHLKWTLNIEPVSLNVTKCLKCGRPICGYHGYPRYKGEIKTENFIGRVCPVCLAEPPKEQVS